MRDFKLRQFHDLFNFSGFTEEEREFSQNAILRQQQANHTDTHEDIDEEDEEDLDDTGHGKDNFFFLHSFYRLFLFRSYIFFTYKI